MSKLSRTKPSTLCKAHIFLILFLLLASNSMSVAGAALGVKLPTTGLAATSGVKLPTTGLAATSGVKLPTTGLAATSVPVPRTPSKSAAPPTLPSPWNWDDMYYMYMHAFIFFFAFFTYIRETKKITEFRQQREDLTTFTKIFYRRFLLASFILVTLVFICLYALCLRF